MEFTYEGLVRYGFGFQNPNHAAALFAALLPICWGLRANFEDRRQRYFVMPVELALYLALVLTYSRAGLVAMLAAALLFYVLRSGFSAKAFFERAKTAVRRRSLWISVTVFLGCAIYFGAFKRYFLWMLSHDSSVGNRFNLWLGSLRMIAENPKGVGFGDSGRIYTLFYQPDGVNLGYRTLVNSFLTFIAEQGLLVAGIFGALTFSVIILSILNFRFYAGGSRIAATAGLSIIASLFVSATLSTCLDLSELLELFAGGDLNAALQSSLPLLGLTAFAVLGTLSIPLLRRRDAALSLSCGAGLSMAILSVIWAFGHLTGDKGVRCEIIHGSDGGKWALLHPGATSVLVLPDGRAINERQAVRFAEANFKGQGVLLPLSGFTGQIPFECGSWLLCGRNAMCFEKARGTVSILLPTEAPPFDKAPPSISRIWLDPFDEYGVNGQWIAMAPGVARTVVSVKLRTFRGHAFS